MGIESFVLQARKLNYFTPCSTIVQRQLKKGETVTQFWCGTRWPILSPTRLWECHRPLLSTVVAIEGSCLHTIALHLGPYFTSEDGQDKALYGLSSQVSSLGETTQARQQLNSR